VSDSTVYTLSIKFLRSSTLLVLMVCFLCVLCMCMCMCVPCRPQFDTFKDADFVNERPNESKDEWEERRKVSRSVTPLHPPIPYYTIPYYTIHCTSMRAPTPFPFIILNLFIHTRSLLSKKSSSFSTMLSPRARWRANASS
jgi:hypothetical protein